MEKKIVRKKVVKKTAVSKAAETKPREKKTTAKKATVSSKKAVPQTELAASQARPVVAQPPAPAVQPEPQPAPSHPETAFETYTTPAPPQSYWQDRYSENRIVLMIRDPYWCFAYWDLTPDKQAEVITKLAGGQAKLVLRIYDVTGIDFTGSNAHRFADLEISEEANNWYLNVWAADRAYCVDLGLRYSDGRFETLLRSNIVTTPRDSISPVVDEEWMVVDDTFERLYKTAGADEWGRSSEAITKYMLKRVRADVTSGGLASMGSAGGRPELKKPEDFWLVVNTELIVYGATEPDAKVFIQGKPLKLNADGSFSVRYALPDGNQEIPVQAVSANDKHRRQITPVVEKRTK